MTEIKQKDIDDFWESDLGKQFVGELNHVERSPFESPGGAHFKRCLKDWLYFQGRREAVVDADLLIQFLGGRPISTLATDDRDKRVVEIDVLAFLVERKLISQSTKRKATYSLIAQIQFTRTREDRAFEEAYKAELAEYEALPWRKRVFKNSPIKHLCYTDSDLKIADEV